MNTITLLSIELFRFVGFGRTGIKLFKCNFTTLLQMLVSSNGSGKSTLISELSIFPINKELFEDDGYKVIRFMFNERAYRLESSHKKHFLYDEVTGENLNPGGTISNLLDLIKSLFNLDLYTWNICTGVSNFTSLDANGRRQWIERISGTDFGYPFRVHKNILGAMNGTKRMLARVEAELAEERVKLISAADLEHYEEQKRLITDLSQKVLLHRGRDISMDKAEEFSATMAEYELRVSNLITKFHSLQDINNKFPEYDNIIDMEHRYSCLRENKAVLETRYSNLLKEIGEKTKLMENFNKGRSINIKDINSSLVQIDKSIAEIHAAISSKEIEELYPLLSELVVTSGTHIVDKITPIAKELTNHLVVGLDFQEDSFYIAEGADEIARMEYALAELTSEFNSVNGYIKMMDEHLREVEHGEDISCEKCGEVFKPGENKAKNQRADLELKIIKRDAILERGKAQRVLLDVVHTRQHNRTKTLEIFSSLPMSLRELFKAYLDSNPTLSSFIQYVDDVTECLSNQLTILELSDDKVKLSQMIDDYHRLMQTEADSNIAVRLEAGEQELIGLQSEQENLVTEMTELEETIKRFRTHELVLNDLADALQQLEEAKKIYLTALEDATLTLISRDLHIELGVISRIVHESEINQTMVNRLTAMVEESKLDLEVYKDLEKTLSPKTGIIADQLVGYCKQFALHTTSVLSRIWGYPMTIEPCKVGRKGLTYKFPIDIGYSRPVSDISKGSKSMLSVTNLAIMLATRESLKLDGLPLFLDEIGSGFDTVHNTRLGEFVSNLLANATCSNVFFVHHDVTMRAMLGKHNSIVLDPKQIIIDDGYNEEVSITYY